MPPDIQYKMGLQNKPDPDFPNAYTSKSLCIGMPYNVICMDGNSWHTGERVCLPILGLPHIDDRAVGSEDGTQLHQHIDMRFLTSKELESMNWKPSTQGALILGRGRWFQEGDIVTTTCWWEVREMLRDFSYTPCSTERKEFIGKYVGCKLDSQMRCPHQGFDLTQVNFQKHKGKKVRVCPGHLLMFDKNGVCTE